ncbi:hypothetical protein UA08_01037 [Talaromyces atroroseus]|uniref:PPM-type phosphatase domain-containing protein n=1 Tax=Talaromyces atroroseus TaxID=1441469 RepID=A0A225APY2_TALAT|nr:hypothetical protein UA08_01037 [Talaromyces atroroseus]OKL63681.1 hypothetical protein UA08_01037 [Talaromyces atroroseus]
MNDPFGEGHGQRPAQTSLSGSYSIPGPTTPTRSYGFPQNHTPSRDPFASITSPHNLRVLLTESELMKKTIQKDLALAKEEIKLRDDQIAKLQIEIQAMHARISQQEITIRNQSRTIQDPRSLRPWLTPPQTANLFIHAAQPVQQVLPHAHPAVSPLHSQGVVSHYVNHQAVSMQRGLDTVAGARTFEPIVPIMEPTSPTRGAPSQQGTITTSSNLSSEVVSTFQGSPYVGFEFETKAAEFGTRFLSLWAKSDQFAKTYGMNFKELNPHQLDACLKDHMMLDGDADVAMQYLNNSVLRPLYVAKVINFYLCKRVLKYTEIVRGFDSIVDVEIANLKRMIVHDTPPVARHSILARIADQVNFVRQQPNFKNFCQGSKDGHGYQLRALLDPLLLHRGRESVAHDLLIELIADAQKIALDLYSCPFDARLHFPEVGEGYDPTCMVILDSSDSRYGITQVRMSVTPFVRLGLNQTDPARARARPVAVQAWAVADSNSALGPSYVAGRSHLEPGFIATFVRRYNHQSINCNARCRDRLANRRYFHDYFVTHLPSSSLHPDSRGPPSFHKLPRSASTPHTSASTRLSPASIQTPIGVNRDTTVVRIPLRSAKHHFGASVSRGSRQYNEDAYQAGVIELPAFAKRSPLSLTINRASGAESVAVTSGADSASGDPQVFYFGVFDGHGGSECSSFLRDRLHEYIQDSAAEFEIQSSLKDKTERKRDCRGRQQADQHGLYRADLPIIQNANTNKIKSLENEMVQSWKYLVGGYFKRFKPSHFSCLGDGAYSAALSQTLGVDQGAKKADSGVSMEELLEYAFLKADLDFVSAQAAKKDDDLVQSDQPLNEDDILYSPSQSRRAFIGGPKLFPGGSTCSVAMISAPTATPFWHPATPSSLLVSHVGDTRVLLCDTATGAAIPLTTDHHPSSPVEANRLRRYAATFVTDSFGEERVSGLANTRAFGDIHSKRIGVSAEPEIRRIEMAPAEFSCLVLMSDGISGTLPDQEIVDIIKEARTPEQAARDVVNFATDISKDADNATCLVVRLGGWERRLEGGLGSMGTKEARDFRRQEATDPRRSRT